MYFTNVAIPYLKEGKRHKDDKTIVLFSSVAGFKQSPGLSIYSVSMCRETGYDQLRLMASRYPNMESSA